MMVTVVLAGLLPNAAGATYNPSWDGGVPVQRNLMADGNFEPSIAAGGDGKAIMAWMETSGSVNHVYASLYTPDGGWGWPVQLDTTGTAMIPLSAMSQNGSAIVAFVDGNTNPNLVTRNYFPGLGWTPQISHGIADAGWRSFSLVMSTEGNALLAFKNGNYSSEALILKFYQPGNGWGTAKNLTGTTSPDYLGWISASIDASGNAAVAYSSVISGESRLMASTKAPGSEWTTPALIDHALSILISIVHDTVKGGYLVAYTKEDGPYRSAYSSFLGTTGWSTPIMIETSNMTKIFAMNMQGNDKGQAVVVTSDLASGVSTFCTNITFYSNGTWSQVNGLHTPLENMAQSACAIDDTGRAVVVESLTLPHGTFGNYANIFTPGLEWTGWERIDGNSNGQTGGMPRVVMTDSGKIIASYTDGRQVWASTYDLGDAPAPIIELDQTVVNVTQSVYVLTGNTSADATLSVNGQSVAVQADGSFLVPVQLNGGVNVITLTATGPYGKTTTTAISVTYTDPAIALQDQLDQAQNKANSAETMALMFGAIGLIGLVLAVVALVMVLRKKKP
jgi:hypothetical protein